VNVVRHADKIGTRLVAFLQFTLQRAEDMIEDQTAPPRLRSRCPYLPRT
jgi:hypothetical protein